MLHRLNHVVIAMLINRVKKITKISRIIVQKFKSRNYNASENTLVQHCILLLSSSSRWLMIPPLAER